MAPRRNEPTNPGFAQWIPLARQVVRTSLRLGWKDVFTIYTYPPTIPLAEALALEARRVGSDTHLTLMTDDLCFTSLHGRSTKWLSSAAPAGRPRAEAGTGHIYLRGPAGRSPIRSIRPGRLEA